LINGEQIQARHSSKSLLRDSLSRAWARRLARMLAEQRQWPADVDLLALSRHYDSLSFSHKRLLAQVLTGTLYTRSRAAKMDVAISPFCPVCSTVDDISHRLACPVSCSAPASPVPPAGLLSSLLPRQGQPLPLDCEIDFELLPC
jgi:hypothetical protein